MERAIRHYIFCEQPTWIDYVWLMLAMTLEALVQLVR